MWFKAVCLKPSDHGAGKTNTQLCILNTTRSFLDFKRKIQTWTEIGTWTGIGTWQGFEPGPNFEPAPNFETVPEF